VTRAAVVERDRVQHRRFRPPRQHVVAFEAAARRIRAVAQQRAVELRRDRAGHAQPDEIDFVGDRRERAAVQVE
jgi:hypothetical protein